MEKEVGRERLWRKTKTARHASVGDLVMRIQRRMLGRMGDGVTWCMSNYSRKYVC